MSHSRVLYLPITAALAGAVSVPVVSFAAESDAASVLEEIIVTANKRNESLEKVGSSVTAIGEDLVVRVHAEDLSDLAAYIPGVSVAASAGSSNRIIMRGVSTGSSDLSPAVGVYIDDAPFGSSSGFALGALFSPDIDPFDLERVEVLRGPQGTLYGASTLSGLVKYVTKKPDLQNWDSYARLEYGRSTGTDTDGYSTRAGTNIPLWRDKMAVRLSGFYSHNDGPLTDVRTGRTGLEERSSQGGRIKLRIKPSDPLTIDLTAFVDESNTPHVGTVDGNAQTLQPIYGEFAGFNYVDGFRRSTYTVTEATVNYDFANGMTLTSATSNSRFKVSMLSDYTTIYVPAFVPSFGALASLLQAAGPVAPSTERFTQELRLASAPSEKFEWMTGLYYTDEDNRYVSGTNIIYNYGAPPPPALAPTLALLSNYQTVINDTKSTEYAGFANVTYYITSTLDVSAGVRYSHNEQDRDVTASGYLQLIGLFPARSGGESNEDVLTESLGVRWHLPGESMLYARYATGWRPGGPTSTSSFDPDETKNYEIGFKTAGLDGRLRADATVFYIDWTNIQLNYFNGTNTVIGNAGDARSRGVELQGTFAPVRSFTVSANVSYTDAEMTRLLPGARGGAVVGDRLPLTSEWAAGLLADYSLPFGGNKLWSLGGGLRYRSEYDSSFPGDTGTRFYTIPSTLFVDARTAISWNDRFGVNLQVLNVAGEHRIAAASQSLAVSAATADAMGLPVQIGFTPDRTYQLSFTAQF
ncbi:TonB-dependent receptor [Peristeroidobacter soli]|uniref:TonB-dependent receptor n=1 Tax=Peristeroidobacter soli TaxID=2497877 RepID=UPI00101C6EB6|nr:TonB-dependent receptor [Peristeroidobacter soli]